MGETASHATIHIGLDGVGKHHIGTLTPDKLAISKHQPEVRDGVGSLAVEGQVDETATHISNDVGLEILRGCHGNRVVFVDDGFNDFLAEIGKPRAVVGQNENFPLIAHFSIRLFGSYDFSWNTCNNRVRRYILYNYCTRSHQTIIT